MKILGADGNRRPLCVILRGLPGAGKTELGKLLLHVAVSRGFVSPMLHSLNDYFLVEQKGGSSEESHWVFKFDASMLEAYRRAAQRAFAKAVEQHRTTFVVVDQVNALVEHFRHYWSVGKSAGFDVVVCELRLSPEQSARRSGHPIERLRKIQESWEAPPAQMVTLSEDGLRRAFSLSGGHPLARGALQRSPQPTLAAPSISWSRGRTAAPPHPTTRSASSPAPGTWHTPKLPGTAARDWTHENQQLRAPVAPATGTELQGRNQRGVIAPGRSAPMDLQSEPPGSSSSSSSAHFDLPRGTAPMRGQHQRHPAAGTTALQQYAVRSYTDRRAGWSQGPAVASSEIVHGPSTAGSTPTFVDDVDAPAPAIVSMRQAGQQYSSASLYPSGEAGPFIDPTACNQLRPVPSSTSSPRLGLDQLQAQWLTHLGYTMPHSTPLAMPMHHGPIATSSQEGLLASALPSAPMEDRTPASMRLATEGMQFLAASSGFQSDSATVPQPDYPYVSQAGTIPPTSYQFGQSHADSVARSMPTEHLRAAAASSVDIASNSMSQSRATAGRALSVRSDAAVLSPSDSESAVRIGMETATGNEAHDGSLGWRESIQLAGSSHTRKAGRAGDDSQKSIVSGSIASRQYSRAERSTGGTPRPFGPVLNAQQDISGGSSSDASHASASASASDSTDPSVAGLRPPSDKVMVGSGTATKALLSQQRSAAEVVPLQPTLAEAPLSSLAVGTQRTAATSSGSIGHMQHLSGLSFPSSASLHVPRQDEQLFHLAGLQVSGSVPGRAELKKIYGNHATMSSGDTVTAPAAKVSTEATAHAASIPPSVVAAERNPRIPGLIARRLRRLRDVNMRIHNPNWARYLQDGSDGYAASLLRNRRKRHKSEGGDYSVASDEEADITHDDQQLGHAHTSRPIVDEALNSGQQGDSGTAFGDTSLGAKHSASSSAGGSGSRSRSSSGSGSAASKRNRRRVREKYLLSSLANSSIRHGRMSLGWPGRPMESSDESEEEHREMLRSQRYKSSVHSRRMRRGQVRDISAHVASSNGDSNQSEAGHSADIEHASLQPAPIQQEGAPVASMDIDLRADSGEAYGPPHSQELDRFASGGSGYATAPSYASSVQSAGSNRDQPTNSSHVQRSDQRQPTLVGQSKDANSTAGDHESLKQSGLLLEDKYGAGASAGDAAGGELPVRPARDRPSSPHPHGTAGPMQSLHEGRPPPAAVSIAPVSVAGFTTSVETISGTTSARVQHSVLGPSSSSGDYARPRQVPSGMPQPPMLPRAASTRQQPATAEADSGSDADAESMGRQSEGGDTTDGGDGRSLQRGRDSLAPNSTAGSRASVVSRSSGRSSVGSSSAEGTDSEMSDVSRSGESGSPRPTPGARSRALQLPGAAPQSRSPRNRPALPPRRAVEPDDSAYESASSAVSAHSSRANAGMEDRKQPTLVLQSPTTRTGGEEWSAHKLQARGSAGISKPDLVQAAGRAPGGQAWGGGRRVDSRGQASVVGTVGSTTGSVMSDTSQSGGSSVRGTGSDGSSRKSRRARAHRSVGTGRRPYRGMAAGQSLGWATSDDPGTDDSTSGASVASHRRFRRSRRGYGIPSRRFSGRTEGIWQQQLSVPYPDFVQRKPRHRLDLKLRSILLNHGHSSAKEQAHNESASQPGLPPPARTKPTLAPAVAEEGMLPGVQPPAQRSIDGSASVAAATAGTSGTADDGSASSPSGRSAAGGAESPVSLRGERRPADTADSVVALNDGAQPSSVQSGAQEQDSSGRHQSRHVQWIDRVRMHGHAGQLRDGDGSASQDGRGSLVASRPLLAASSQLGASRRKESSASAGSSGTNAVHFVSPTQTRLAVVVGLSAAAAIEQKQVTAGGHLSGLGGSAEHRRGVPPFGLEAGTGRNAGPPRRDPSRVAVGGRRRGLNMGMDVHPNVLQHLRRVGRSVPRMRTGSHRRRSHEKTARARQRVDAGEALVAFGAMAKDGIEGGGEERTGGNRSASVQSIGQPQRSSSPLGAQSRYGDVGNNSVDLPTHSAAASSQDRLHASAPASSTQAARESVVKVESFRLHNAAAIGSVSAMGATGRGSTPAMGVSSAGYSMSVSASYGFIMRREVIGQPRLHYVPGVVGAQEQRQLQAQQQQPSIAGAQRASAVPPMPGSADTRGSTVWHKGLQVPLPRFDASSAQVSQHVSVSRSNQTLQAVASTWAATQQSVQYSTLLQHSQESAGFDIGAPTGSVPRARQGLQDSHIRSRPDRSAMAGTSSCRQPGRQLAGHKRRRPVSPLPARETDATSSHGAFLPDRGVDDQNGQALGTGQPALGDAAGTVPATERVVRSRAQGKTECHCLARGQTGDATGRGRAPATLPRRSKRLRVARAASSGSGAGS